LKCSKSVITNIFKYMTYKFW